MKDYSKRPTSSHLFEEAAEPVEETRKKLQNDSCYRQWQQILKTILS
jgi:hypothetical protein